MTESKQSKAPLHRRRATWIAAGLAAALVVGGAIVYKNVFHLRWFGAVEEGVLYRCRQPRGLRWRVLDRYGIHRVINLRTEVENPDELAESKRVCREKGVEFVHIPVASLLPNDEQIEQFLRAVRTSEGPVLLHCQHGRHRTGFMSACYRVVVQDWPVRRAIDVELIGYNAEPKAEDDDKLTKTVAILTRLKDNRAEWLAKTAPPVLAGAETAAR